MRLVHASWLEVEAYLEEKQIVVIPAGSTEQHGPMGLIGTDAICAEEIAWTAGEKSQVYIAPTLALTPAPFNLGFPGTISVSENTFSNLVNDVVDSLSAQGFKEFYFLNGHGANLAPLRDIQQNRKENITLKSWWDFPKTNALRQELYGQWEGMHATPSEISITQAKHRMISSDLAKEPPALLTIDYIKAHAGDKHGPPDEHRRDFPDGRVGSHSALASKTDGIALLNLAAEELSEELSSL